MKAYRLPEAIGTSLLTGVIAPCQPLVLADLIRRSPDTVTIVICPRLLDARQLAATTPQLAEDKETSLTWAVLPAPPQESGDDPLPERLREEIECDRLSSLTHLANWVNPDPGKGSLVVFTTPDGLFSPVAPVEMLRKEELQLVTGEKVIFAELKHRLASELDYFSEAICERPGQFAVRGGLIDVYPLNASAPVRLDFFGDELESIREFNPTTQRSIGNLNRITIASGRAVNIGTSPRGIFGYFSDSVNWILVEPAEIRNHHPDQFQVFEKIEDHRGRLAALVTARTGKADHWTAIQEFETDSRILASAPTITRLDVTALEVYRENPLETTVGLERLEEETRARLAFLETLRHWHGAGDCRIIGLVSSNGKVEELKNLLRTDGFADVPVEYRIGDLPQGFLFRGIPDTIASGFGCSGCRDLVLVTEREWIGRHIDRKPVLKQRLLPHRTRVDHLLDFADLADGDYLVHLSHGICRYRGLAPMDIRGRVQDVISVEFAENITLHVPLSEAHLLTRYVGLSRVQPKLGRLGSNTWEKTRAAAEKATLDYAAEMLELQATRSHRPGHAFAPDSEWQSAFENAFPYKETEDQAQAIEDAKLDMEAARPMDRLVCGDVGFGKTEVAIRAAFKAVMEGFQVAIMVPTTVLAQQHYETFRERFSPYPLSLAMLSRFRSTTQQKEIVRQLAEGELDLVIGTHRLLSRDVRFSNLGLLVIDEEHRFGVRHKERLKRYKSEVDVLSMSATPIPRTLYLALMGARDLSVIETPPADRLPIETLVRTYDPELVKRAIQRELDRGGQVFYLHNRVQSIQSVAARLGDMLPGASIEVGHGQMPEHTLERVMTRFVAGKTDILVCTTIIENGLDIPNCNTIIIEGADRFGLSQLYQLRGRVGRFKRQAYAYLLLHRHVQILDQAHKRLSAMRQYNQLGAGFRIAMRDLELRGAGNLLGHQQSGHIAGVGFDLYCQLLRQSIQRLKGDVTAARIRASIYLDFIRDGRREGSRSIDSGFQALVDAEIEEHRIKPVSANIPPDYVPESRLRIDFYRQLAMANSLDEVSAIRESLTDRFGRRPRPVERLIRITRIRILAETAGIGSVETDGNRLKCRLSHSRKGEFIQLSGRFPRLTGQSADLRLREIEQFLTRLCHNQR